ncbi:unnamed protein product [Owenia fusiformis]|uniref:Uncharacterized protein n=1 Tax=Owenia fusiformis TaxID=6347 RepID=A0A8J1T4X8_OWEFU|nr:unnamed protein product [Owenia fusiformis]
MELQFYSYVLVTLLCIAETGDAIRQCWVCSGPECLTAPHSESLYPGRLAMRKQCPHEVLDYCVTSVRYGPRNESRYREGLLNANDYYAVSVSRSCSKVDQSNTCKRDYYGLNITCIHTCNQDYCNCMNRSPPRKMFTKDLQAAGTSEKYRGVLYSAPYESKWDGGDQAPCVEAKKYLAKTKHKRPSTEDDEDDFWRKHGRRMNGGSSGLHFSYMTLLGILIINISTSQCSIYNFSWR